MFKRTLFAALLLLGSVVGAAAQPLPPPVLTFDSKEMRAGLVHVDLTVVNWAVYSPVLFFPAPALPPCGVNPNASRTWVDIMNAQTHRRIYGFCALGTNLGLTQLWFATPPAGRPHAVYIIMTDRATKRRVRSNIVRIP